MTYNVGPDFTFESKGYCPICDEKVGMFWDGHNSCFECAICGNEAVEDIEDEEE